MKKILISLILITSSLMYGQGFPDLIREYEKDCNGIVKDTIKQHGVINYSMIPVKGISGKIVYYALGNPDTTWNKPNCPEYKYGNSVYWSDQYSHTGNVTLTNLTYTTTGYIENTTEAEKQKVSVTRDYQCECKKRPIGYFTEHFWNWIKNQ